jgi:hypothetical protein
MVSEFESLPAQAVLFRGILWIVVFEPLEECVISRLTASIHTINLLFEEY